MACLAVFLVQQVTARVEFVYGYTYAQVLVATFGLNGPLFCRGFFWQPLTYLFLHAGWLHLCLNMATVLLFGSGVEMEVGGRRFWRIFLGGGILAGLGWFAVTVAQSLLPSFVVLTHWMPAALRQWLGGGANVGQSLDAGLPLIGASGGVFALIGAFMCCCCFSRFG